MNGFPSHKNKTACIAGGGFAGLSAAVFLDSLGFKVSLFEKKPILGGRTYAFRDKKTDMWVDNGQHLLIGAYHETLKFLENIGVTRHLYTQQQTDVPLISDKKRVEHFRMNRLPPPLNFLLALARMKMFSFKEKWSFIKMGRELKRLKNGSPTFPLDQTVKEWLIGLGQSENVRTNFWDPLTLATLNDLPDLANARMLSMVLIKSFLGLPRDSRLIFPKSHLNDLVANPARAYLELRGHRLLTGLAVKKIHILDEKVQGFELESGELVKADYYLSAVPPQGLLRIIPQRYIDCEPYFGKITQLKSSPIISINLWFDKDVLPYPFVGVANAKVHWYFNKNRLYNETHPPYHYMGVISGAYALVDQPLGDPPKGDVPRDEIIKMALAEFHEFFPESLKATLIHSLVNKEREATLSPRVGSETCRPLQKSPFDNFFVIGDWTNTGYPATIESAVLSARMAANAIQQQIESTPEKI